MEQFPEIEGYSPGNGGGHLFGERTGGGKDNIPLTLLFQTPVTAFFSTGEDTVMVWACARTEQSIWPKKR